MSFKRAGSLRVYVGPMASGKTTMVIDALIKHALVTNEKVLFIKSNRDTRSDKYSTHCGMRDARDFELITFMSVGSLSEVDYNDLIKYRVIGVDEVQFFDDLYQCISNWVNAFGKHVYASGLDSDSKMKQFGQTCLLSVIADSYEKLNAVCKPCIDEMPEVFVNAPFQSYVGKAPKDGQVLIGGLADYAPTCRRHQLENMNIVSSSYQTVK